MKLKETVKDKKFIVVFGVVITSVIVLCFVCATFIYLFSKPGGEDPVEPEDSYLKELDVAITQPTSRTWYVTSEDSVRIGGIYSGGEELSISLISSTNREQLHPIIDGEMWYSDLILEDGDNHAEVSISDATGSVVDEIIILKTEEGKGENFNINKEYLTLGKEDEEVVFRTTFKSPPAEDIYLYQVESLEGEIETSKRVEKLFDDGKESHGDEKAGDGIYSLKLLTKVEEKTPLHFRVGYGENPLLFLTEALALPVYEEPTKESYIKLTENLQKIEVKYEITVGAIENIEDFEIYRGVAEEMATWLNQQEFIEEAGTSKEGTGIWWELKESGILGGIGRSSSQNLNQKSALIDGFVKGSSAQEEIIEKEPHLGNQKSLYLGPSLSSFKLRDDYYFAVDEIKRSSCPKYEIIEKKDSDVSVEDFKLLDQYSIIVISSHGDTWFNNRHGVRNGYVTIHTTHLMTFEEYLEYYPELKSQTLAVSVRQEGYNFVILPQFIEKYNGGMPNSLVYVSACRSAYNSSMAKVFLGAGAKTYYGYSEYVSSSYAFAAGGNLMNNYIHGDETTLDAYKSARRLAGTNDGDTPPAYFVMYGEKDLVEKEDPCCDNSCISGKYMGTSSVPDTNSSNQNRVVNFDVVVRVEADGTALGTVQITEPEYNVVLDPENSNPLILDTRSAYGSGSAVGSWDLENQIITYAESANGADVAKEVTEGDFHSITLEGSGSYTLDSAKNGVVTNDTTLYMDGAVSSGRMHLFIDLGQQVQYRMWLEKVE